MDLKRPADAAKAVPNIGLPDRQNALTDAALAPCRELPVRQAAALLRCTDKQLWRRIEHCIEHCIDVCVEQARALDDMSAVKIVGIDDTSLHKGQSHITVVHDLDAKRLLFATEGRDHQTVVDFAADLEAHGGDPDALQHACQDMSAAYAKGVGIALPLAAISYDRFHVVAMAVDAMDKVRWTRCARRRCATSRVCWPKPWEQPSARRSRP